MKPAERKDPLDFLNFITGKPYLSHLILFCVGFIGPMIMVFQYGPPLPQVHDEFSYLLMADTFASGRLSNPSHPLGEYLESFHILVDPTYSSKYFPLQGLVLALGILIGHPIIGIWILCGLIGSAFYYAAKAIVPDNLAWVAALVILIQFVILNNWAYQYWGGLPFCLSGVLVMGSVFHQSKSPRLVHGILTGAGIGGILLTRPLEGFFFCLPFAILSLQLLWRTHGKKHWIQLVVPQAVLIFVSLGFLGLYNKATTGNVFLFPHTVYHEEYLADLPRLAWDDFEDDRLINRPERKSHFVDLYKEDGSKNLIERIARFTAEIGSWVKFYFPWFVILLVLFIFIRGTSLSGLVIWSLGGLILMRLAIIPFSAWGGFPHYTAAWVAMSLGLFACGMHNASKVIGPRTFRLSLGMIVCVQLFQFSLAYASSWDPGLKKWTTLSDLNFGKIRDDLEHRIASSDWPSEHVVLVKYLPGHNVETEWVYNGANIDEQRVVWLHFQDEETLDVVAAYYPQRKIWQLETPGDGGLFELTTLVTPDSGKDPGSR